MTKKFFETNQFKKLNKEWSQKLKTSGFHDIESELDKQYSTGGKEKYAVDSERIAYFKQCEKFLHSYQFQSPLNQFIFEKHCEGISNREIVDLLPTHNLKHLQRKAVDERLKKLLKIAGIKPILFKF